MPCLGVPVILCCWKCFIYLCCFWLFYCSNCCFDASNHLPYTCCVEYLWIVPPVEYFENCESTRKRDVGCELKIFFLWKFGFTLWEVRSWTYPRYKMPGCHEKNSKLPSHLVALFAHIKVVFFVDKRPFMNLCLFRIYCSSVNLWWISYIYSGKSWTKVALVISYNVESLLWVFMQVIICQVAKILSAFLT